MNATSFLLGLMLPFALFGAAVAWDWTKKGRSHS